MQIGAASSILPSDLVGLTRFLTNTQDNVNAFIDTNIVALLNLEYRETQSYLLSQILYSWKENATDGTGTGLISLVSGTSLYSLPTDLMTIDRVEINYTGTDNGWVVVEPIKLDAIDGAINNTSGNSAIEFSKSRPKYWARDGYIHIDPIPDQSVTSGLKIYCTTVITDLLIGGAGDQLTPVFNASFHHILAYEPAIKWLTQKGRINEARELERKKIQARVDLVRFYSQRQGDEQVSLTAKSRNLF